MPAAGRVPKICGADVELGNFVLDPAGGEGRGNEAAQALLAELSRIADGVSDWRSFLTARRGGPRNPQDWRRCYFPGNGGGAYLDLQHAEVCLPEVRSAWDHVAAWHATLRLTQRALAAANAARAGEGRIHALVNNGDGLGNSWGSHLNFMVSRQAWDELVHRRPHYLAWLAAFQISSIIYTGQGRVGCNDDPSVGFQLSQRADFFEALAGPQTTHRRPVVNTRDEALAGREERCRRDDPASGGLARLHVIFFDSVLAQVPCLLRVGTMQVILAMLEAGRVQADLALDDPLRAVRAFSRDPWLEVRVPLAGGGEIGAVELQRRFFDAAGQFVAAGECEGLVPRADELVSRWGDVLDRLERRDWPALARQLDWVLKLSLLRRVLRQRPEMGWGSPDLRLLDQLYGSLDPDAGLFWSFSRRGLVEEVVSDDAIRRLMHEPPDDTRAWGRAMLLRHAPRGAIESVDWDEIRFELERGDRLERWRLDLGSPLDFTRDALEPVWPGPMGTTELGELLRALGAEPQRWQPICDDHHFEPGGRHALS
jgi:proteasome accessory factor A